MIGQTVYKDIHYVEFLFKELSHKLYQVDQKYRCSESNLQELYLVK